MIDLTTLPIAALETAINQYLKLDPDVLPKLAKHKGQVLKIEFTDLPIILYCLPDANGIRIMQQYAGDADTTLKGSVWALSQLGLTRSPSKMRELFQDDLSMSGDTEFGQAFKSILSEMDIDWEEHLSTLFGDVFAHQVGSFASNLNGARREFSQTITQNISEYAKEEARLCPSREEVEDFFKDISQLRDDVERLQARVDQLKG